MGKQSDTQGGKSIQIWQQDMIISLRVFTLKAVRTHSPRTACDLSETTLRFRKIWKPFLDYIYTYLCRTTSSATFKSSLQDYLTEMWCPCVFCYCVFPRCQHLFLSLLFILLLILLLLFPLLLQSLLTVYVLF